MIGIIFGLAGLLAGNPEGEAAAGFGIAGIGTLVNAGAVVDVSGQAPVAPLSDEASVEQMQQYCENISSLTRSSISSWANSTFFGEPDANNKTILYANQTFPSPDPGTPY